MIASADHRRRPRRFFGLRGVVRSLRSERSIQSGPHRTTEADRAIQSERVRFAAKLDLELRLACRGEATIRRELGCAARELIGRRSYRRLGFVRLSDYARERLGVSARTLQSAAWLETRLDALPAVSRAYDRSELSWAQARAICKVAVAADQDRWIALARRSTVETLERLVTRARQPDGVPPNPDNDANEIDGEPVVRWRFACPARVRALWRRALELASRAAGEPLAEWRAAEIVAAEASSGRPAGTSPGDRVLIAATRLAHRARRNARDDHSIAPDPLPKHLSWADSPAGGPLVEQSPRGDSVASESLARQSPRGDVLAPDSSAPGSDREMLSLEPPAPSDPFAHDARLVEAMRALRTLEPRIGRLLRVAADQRIYRSFGYPSLDDYVRERLGISARKAWALLKVEKATLRSGDFAAAYRDGRLSWVRALTLLPVLERIHGAAWVARAESVTVRRLSDEVDWVLATRDALGSTVSLAPPAVDSRLPSPIVAPPPAECRNSSLDGRLQIRAHDAALEVCDAEVRLTGPVSVVALLRDVLDAFAEPNEPRWTGLERLLRHVITHWESTPRHHDPVFARDGWRCTVPACSSRRNLHDHHIRFRSRGGDNRRDNRTVVCAGPHLHGIHDGTIHASGIAPHAIEWHLGVRSGGSPLLRYIGDRYCHVDAEGGGAGAAAMEGAAMP